MTRRDLEAWQLLIGTTSELMKEMDVGNGRYQLSKSSAFIEGNFIDTVQREVLLTRFAHSEEELWGIGRRLLPPLCCRRLLVLQSWAA